MRRFLWWVKDSHPWPHVMKNGGCFCSCNLCIKNTDGFYRCICKRCNEQCTSMGRLGDEKGVWKEWEEGDPKGGYIVGRWFRR